MLEWSQGNGVTVCGKWERHYDLLQLLMSEFLKQGMKTQHGLG